MLSKKECFEILEAFNFEENLPVGHSMETSEFCILFELPIEMADYWCYIANTKTGIKLGINQQEEN